MKFVAVMSALAVKASWSSRKKYTGRHSLAAVGTLQARPARSLILQLRRERDHRIFRPLHDDTLTVMLVA